MLDVYLESFAALKNETSRLSALESAIAAAQPDEAAPYLYLAQLQDSAKAFHAAARTYGLMTSRWPSLRDAHAGAAYALAQTGDDAAAVSHLRNAWPMLRQDPQANYLLGSSLVRMGDVSAGIVALREALRLRPNLLEARFNLALTLAGAGDHDEAIAEFRRLLAHDPAHAAAYVTLTTLLVYTDQPDEARRYALRGQKERPNHPEMAEAVALSVSAAGRFDEALAAAGVARQRGGDEVVCTLVEALARHGLGDANAVTEARAALEQARRCPGGSPVRRVLVQMATREFGTLPSARSTTATPP